MPQTRTHEESTDIVYNKKYDLYKPLSARGTGSNSEKQNDERFTFSKKQKTKELVNYTVSHNAHNNNDNYREEDDQYWYGYKSPKKMTQYHHDVDIMDIQKSLKKKSIKKSEKCVELKSSKNQ